MPELEAWLLGFRADLGIVVVVCVGVVGGSEGRGWMVKTQLRLKKHSSGKKLSRIGIGISDFSRR